MIREYSFFINDMQFEDKKFNLYFIEHLKDLSPKLQEIIGPCELDGENDLAKCSHQINFSIDKRPIIRIRIFRSEDSMNQHTETVQLRVFFAAVSNILMRDVSIYVNAIKEANNARKH